MDTQTDRLLAALSGMDLTSADGRAGIATALAEIERKDPGAILQAASRIDLGRILRRNRRQ